MNKLIYPRHVQPHGTEYTFIVNLAGERIRGPKYGHPRHAAWGAELFKYYVRARYGTKISTMRASVSEEDLRAWAAEAGFELRVPVILQYLSPDHREMFNDRGDEIGRNLANLEYPSTKQVIVRETLREAREHREALKRRRLELKDKLSKERAEVWLQAQQKAAEAWKQAKIELESLRKEKLTNPKLPSNLRHET